MLTSDLISQFKMFLPLFTDFFTTNIPITSASILGTTVTIDTATPHGLETGEFVTLSGIKNSLSISSLTSSDLIATATTSVNNDLTKDFIPNIEISGATEPEYNGTKPLLDVLNRTTFTYQLNATTTTPATGTPVLLETHNLSFNGSFAVTVTSTTQFEVTNNSPGLGTPVGTNMQAKTGIRVSGLNDIERGIDVYTKKKFEELWGFVVLNDAVINKDRDMNSDAEVERTPRNEYRMKFINNFSFYVFVPTAMEINGRQGRDLCEQLARPVFRSIAGYQPQSIFVSKQSTIVTPINHGFFLYNTAYYIHRYQFQYTEYMVNDAAACPTNPNGVDEFFPTGGDTRPIIDTVAFRDVNYKIDNPFDEIVQDGNISLDKEII